MMHNWFPFMVLLIPILVVLASIFKRWAALTERRLELAARTAGEQAAQYAAKIERLEARVAVLDRIATDRSDGLAAEIEGLRALPAASIQ